MMSTLQSTPARGRTTTVPTVSAGRREGIVRRLLRSPQVRTGLIMIALTVLIVLLGPLLSPHDPTRTIGAPLSPPSGDAPFGTDAIGRDVLSRTLHGGINLLWMGPAAALIGTALGAVIGLASAFFRKRTDTVLMRSLDVLLAFPGIILALLVVTLFPSNTVLLVVVTGVMLMPGVALVIRGAALPINNGEFVMWARAIGLPSRTILWREFLPNIITPLMVEFGVRLMWAIGILATLSFLGLGISPPTPDWGLMVSENRSGLGSNPLSVFAPIVMIVLFTAGGNLVAEGAARVIARTEGKATR